MTACLERASARSAGLVDSGALGFARAASPSGGDFALPGRFGRTRVPVVVESVAGSTRRADVFALDAAGRDSWARAGSSLLAGSGLSPDVGRVAAWFELGAAELARGEALRRPALLGRRELGFGGASEAKG